MSNRYEGESENHGIKLPKSPPKNDKLHNQKKESAKLLVRNAKTWYYGTSPAAAVAAPTPPTRARVPRPWPQQGSMRRRSTTTGRGRPA